MAVVSPKTLLGSESWPLGANMLPVNLKQCQVNKTTFPTQERGSQSPNVWHSGSSVGSLAQSGPHSRPTRGPSPHPPSGAVSAPGGTGVGLLFLGSAR